jgi:hypothetical protein
VSDFGHANDDRMGEATFAIEGGHPLEAYVRAFHALDALYDGLLTLDRLIDALSDGRDFGIRERLLFAVLRGDPIDHMVLPSERLVLSSIEAASPGRVSLIGDIKLLEQIRLWLSDRAERRKDRDYRNREEARRLDLENQQRETELLRARVAAMREMGLPEADIVTVVRQLVGLPIQALEAGQDAIGIGSGNPDVPTDDETEVMPPDGSARDRPQRSRRSGQGRKSK